MLHVAAVLTQGCLRQDVSICGEHLHDVCWPSLLGRRNRSRARSSHPELSKKNKFKQECLCYKQRLNRQI